MRRETIYSLACLCGAGVLCLCLVFGGCGKGDAGKRSAAPAPETAGRSATIRIGDHPGLIGRVEEEATVVARVFDAAGGHGEPAVVAIVPGTWLVPASAIRAPVSPDETDKESFHAER